MKICFEMASYLETKASYSVFTYGAVLPQLPLSPYPLVPLSSSQAG